MTTALPLPEPDRLAELFRRTAMRFDRLAEFMDEQGWIPARAVYGSKECYEWARGNYDYRSTDPDATEGRVSVSAPPRLADEEE